MPNYIQTNLIQSNGDGSLLFIPSGSAYALTSSTPSLPAQIDIIVSNHPISNLIDNTELNPYLQIPIISGSNFTNGVNQDLLIRFFTQSHVKSIYQNRVALSNNISGYILAASESLYVTQSLGENFTFRDISYIQNDSGSELRDKIFNIITGSAPYRQTLISASFNDSTAEGGIKYFSCSIHYNNSKGEIHTPTRYTSSFSNLSSSLFINVPRSGTGSLNFSEPFTMPQASASLQIQFDNDNPESIEFATGLASLGYTASGRTEPTLLYFSSSGDIGVGTKNPKSSIDISGSIKSDEIIIPGPTEGRPIKIKDSQIKFYETTETDPQALDFSPNKEKARIRAAAGSFNLIFEVSGSEGYTNSVFISQSGKIGFNTDDPQSGFDAVVDEAQFQKPGSRAGLKINSEGNIESFDRSAATAATGSEVILKYSRGINLNSANVALMTGGTIEEAVDAAAETAFLALPLASQNKFLEKGEALGLVSPPTVGDVLGQVRWVAESGSIGDQDERVAGETAVIKAVVSAADDTGTSADLIFSVANKTDGAQQRLLLDATNNHQLTGSLNVSATVTAEQLTSTDDITAEMINLSSGAGGSAGINLGTHSHIFESGGLVLDGGTSTRPVKLRFNGTDSLIVGKGSHITASANISASGKLQSTGLEFGHFNNFLNFTAGGTSNTFKYNEWKQSASGGTTISNTAGTINFDSKLNADTMVISGSSVGIGTTSPQHILDVTDSGIDTTAPTIRLTNTANYNASAWGDNISHRIEFYSSDPSGPRVASTIENIAGADKGGLLTGNLAFKTANYPSPGTLTEKMRITEDGNVGIGTTSPGEKLHVAGNITSSGKITVGADGNGSDFKVFGEKANTFMHYDASEEQLTIKHPRDQAGLTVFTTSSGIPTGGGQIRVGRDAGQYIGLKTLDRDAHFIHRQDETDHGTARTYFEIWDSSYPTSGSHHWAFRSADGSGGTLATRMLISSSGNVGIGTSSPLAKLQVTAGSSGVSSVDTGTSMLVESNTTNYLRFINPDDQTGGLVWTSPSDNFAAFIRWKYNDRVLSIATAKTNSHIDFFTDNADRVMRLASGGNVGIGTITPTEKLTVEGNISASGTGSFSDGRFTEKVGIGTTSPSEKLHIYGNVNDDVKLKIENDFSGKNAVLVVDGGSSGDAIIHLAEASSVKGIITYDGGTDVLKIINDGSTGTEHFAMDTSGNVGIGTFSPTEKLQVTGNISASGNITAGAGDTVVISGTGIVLNRSNAYIQSDADNSDTLNIGQSSVRWGHVKVDAADFAVLNGGNERMRVASSGNVGIGTTTPPKELTVEGEISASDNINLPSNKSVQWPGGSIRAEGTTLKLVADSLIDLQDNSQVQGDLTVTGTLTAQEFKTEFVSASIMFESGSTKFGDTLDDRHEMTGSLLVTGSAIFDIGGRELKINNISGYPRIQADNNLFLDGGGLIQLATNTIPSADGTIKLGQSNRYFSELYVNQINTNHITASGNISASGNLYAQKYYIHPTKETYIGSSDSGDDLLLEAVDDIRIRPTDDVLLYGNDDTIYTHFDGANKRVGIGTSVPSRILHLSGSDSDTAILLERSTNDAIIEVKTSTAGAYFNANSAGTANYAGLQLQGAGSNLWFIGQYGYADFSITDGSKNAGTRHFTVQNTTGNVGIGTTSPDESLHVSGGKILVRHTSTEQYNYKYGNSDTWSFGGGDYFTIKKAGSRLFTLTGNGNVGIGSTSPGEKLEVVGNISASGGITAASFTGSFSGAVTGDATGLTGTPDISVRHITASGNISSSGTGNNIFQGNVGIGTNSPARQLHVNSSFRCDQSGGVNIRGIHADYFSSTQDIQLQGGTSGSVIIPAGYERALLIGTSTPAALTEKLVVAGNISASGTGSFESIAIPSANTDYYIGGSGGGAATGTTLRIGSKTTGNTIAMELFHATNPVSLGVSYSGGDALAFVDSVHSSFDSVLQFKTGGSERFRIGALDSNTFQIKPAAAANDVEITDNSGAIILYSDTSTKRIGIGTSTPTEALQVSGSISASGDLLLKGPSSRIHVVDSDGGNYGIELLPTNGPMINFGDTDSAPNSLMTFGAFSSTNNINTRTRDFHLFGTNTTTGFYFDEGEGNFGIGTTSPGEKLEVIGNISASGDLEARNITASNIQVANDIALGGNIFSFSGFSFIEGVSANFSGSNVFGSGSSPGANDIAGGGTAHQFTGSVAITGSSLTLSNNLNVGDDIIITNGSFGIGTTSPEYILDIQGDSPVLRIADDNIVNSPSASAIWMGENGSTETRGAGIIYDGHANTINLVTSNNGSLTNNNPYNAERRLTIQESDGNVGIGTTSPSTKLQIDNGGSGTVDSAYSLAIRGDGIDGIHILSSNAHEGRIVFGDADDNDRGQIKYDHATDSMKFKVNASDAMIITGSNGNVGIGTTSPVAKLHVDSNTAFSLTAGSGDTLFLTDNSVSSAVGAVGASIGFGNAHHDERSAAIASLRTGGDHDNIGLAFYTHPSNSDNETIVQQMIIDHSGNVGIGTETPGEKLTVNSGYISVTGSGASGYGYELARNGLDTYRIQHLDGGLTIFNQTDTRKEMTFDGAGNVGIGTASPTEKLQVEGNISASGEVNINAADALFSSALTVNGDAYTTAGWKLGSSATFVGKAYNSGGKYSIETDTNRDIQFGDAETPAVMFIDTSEENVGIGTTTPTASLDVVGDIRVLSASLSYQENTDIDSTTATVATLATGSYDAGFFDYVAKNGTNLRAGIVTAIHSASIVQYNEVSTVDIGDTSDVKLSVVETGGNLALQATTTTDNWNIKSLVRGL